MAGKTYKEENRNLKEYNLEYKPAYDEMRTYLREKREREALACALSHREHIYNNKTKSNDQ